MRLLLVPVLFIGFLASSAVADIRADVRALFDSDMTDLDFAQVMVDVERIINPRVDAEAVLAEIDRMATHIATAIPSTAPEWEKIAKGLEGIINVGAVDMTTDQAAGAKYGIKGFPTIKFFGNNKYPDGFAGMQRQRLLPLGKKKN